MVRHDVGDGDPSWRCSRFPECFGRVSSADAPRGEDEPITPILQRPRVRPGPESVDASSGADSVMPAGSGRKRPTALIVLAVGVALVLLLWATVSLLPQERGYRVVCADGWVSYSGGIQGACSDHGGIRR